MVEYNVRIKPIGRTVDTEMNNINGQTLAESFYWTVVLGGEGRG